GGSTPGGPGSPRHGRPIRPHPAQPIGRDPGDPPGHLDRNTGSAGGGWLGRAYSGPVGPAPGADPGATGPGHGVAALVRTDGKTLDGDLCPVLSQRSGGDPPFPREFGRGSPEGPASSILRPGEGVIGGASLDQSYMSACRLSSDPWYPLPMAIEIRPATDFDDVATMLGPKKNPDANVCWCLSYRLTSKENRSLTGPARGERVRRLLEEGPIGVLAYEGEEVVGWAAVAPRAETSFAHNRKIPHVDDLDVWSVWCVR